LSSIKHGGGPWELGLAETQQALVANDLRSRCKVRVDGGLKTGRDVLLAALRGADEFGFGPAALLAEGCLMVRTCHQDNCPVGIATQRPDLRAKFTGTPDMVVHYLEYVAQEVRELLASLGLRRLDEAVGRVDLLAQRPTGDPRADSLDLGPLLATGAEDAPEGSGEPRTGAPVNPAPVTRIRRLRPDPASPFRAGRPDPRRGLAGAARRRPGPPPVPDRQHRPRGRGPPGGGRGHGVRVAAARRPGP